MRMPAPFLFIRESVDLAGVATVRGEFDRRVRGCREANGRKSPVALPWSLPNAQRKAPKRTLRVSLDIRRIIGRRGTPVIALSGAFD
jgi:hypothetical protein